MNWNFTKGKKVLLAKRSKIYHNNIAVNDSHRQI